jgi:hypothetical protein
VLDLRQPARTGNLAQTAAMLKGIPSRKEFEEMALCGRVHEWSECISEPRHRCTRGDPTLRHSGAFALAFCLHHSIRGLGSLCMGAFGAGVIGGGGSGESGSSGATAWETMPVTFPPGRGRLCTNPWLP